MEITLTRLDSENLHETKLPNGKHVLGRGPLLPCKDKRISRNHASLGISDSGDIVLESLHVNPCYYKHKDEAEFKSLKKNEKVQLQPGDEFQLSPDSYCYKIELVEAKNDKLKEDESKKDENEQETTQRTLPDWMTSSAETEKKPKKERGDDNEEREAKRMKRRSESEKEENIGREPCKYGAQCYRRNPAHKEEFSHPGDTDWTDSQEAAASETVESSDLPECPYGTSCYRRNPKHRKEYKHTPKPKSQRKKRTAHSRSRDEDYESDGTDDYDYDDPFIDDTDEIEEEDSEDEDWEVTAADRKREEETNPRLLDEEEWKAKPEDEPEVLELLKEAKEFLRNKKMQRH